MSTAEGGGGGLSTFLHNLPHLWKVLDKHNIHRRNELAGAQSTCVLPGNERLFLMAIERSSGIRSFSALSSSTLNLLHGVLPDWVAFTFFTSHPGS